MILQAPVARLLRLIIERKDFSFLADEGISEGDFLPKQSLTAFQWLKSFHAKWNTFPDLSTVNQEIGVELPAAVEEPSFVVRTFKEYSQGKKLAAIIEEATSYLETKDVRGAINELKKIDQLQTTEEFGRSFRETAAERYDRYEEGKLKAKSGLGTPWPSLTDQIIGYLPASLNTIIAMSNVGKTWASVIHAIYFMQQGHRVAFVTLEDSIEIVENRLDSYCYKINNKHLNQHQLLIRDDVQWRLGLLANMEGDGDILVYSGNQVQTVADLATVVDSSKAEILIVDAAYCLQATGIEAGWKTSETVVNQLKQLMHDKNIPIIITVQQDPEQVKKRTKHERLYSTRSGKFWGIGSNLVIELSSDEDQRLRKEARISILKNKNYVHSENNQTGEIDIHWNLLKMEFGEIQGDETLEEIEW